MAFTVRITKSAVEGSTSLSQSTDHSCDTVSKMNETIPDAASEDEYIIGIDVSKLQAFAMLSNQDLTVETNSPSSPQETFNLTANSPVVWETGETAIFAGDVTALYISNSSGSDATFTLIAGVTS